MSRQLRDVVFVDGVRTPFGRSKGQYAETRADDLVITCIRDLLRRNPGLPPERVDEVAIAAMNGHTLGSGEGSRTSGSASSTVTSNSSRLSTLRP